MRRFRRPQALASAGAVFYRIAARLERPGPVAPVLRFDHARVLRIRRVLREGRFTVTAMTVAERLVQRLRRLATAIASRPGAG